MKNRENYIIFERIFILICIPGFFLAPLGVISFKTLALIYAIPHLVYGCMIYLKFHMKRDLGYILSGIIFLVFYFILRA